jgi:hypothetical protein
VLLLLLQLLLLLLLLLLLPRQVAKPFPLPATHTSVAKCSNGTVPALPMCVGGVAAVARNSKYTAGPGRQQAGFSTPINRGFRQSKSGPRTHRPRTCARTITPGRYSPARCFPRGPQQLNASSETICVL